MKIASNTLAENYRTSTPAPCPHSSKLARLKNFLPPLATFALSLLLLLLVQIVYAESATSASLTLTLPPAISLDIQPTATFTKSTASSFSAQTDGPWGYHLAIKAKTTTDMTSGASILAALPRAMTEAEYAETGNNNTWGFLPSKLNSQTNDSYLAIATSPTTIDRTDSASATADSANAYSVTLAAKADAIAAEGTYSNTIVLILSANTMSYNLTYDCGSGSPCPTAQTGNTSDSNINLSPTSPSLDGFEFQGWCTTAVTENATAVPNCPGTTLQPGAPYTLNSGANSLTLTAIWRQSVAYIQNWPGCSSLGTEETVTLTDQRDNNTYTVSKLQDGRCWMTQDLAIGENDPMTLTPDSSDVTENYTLPGNSSRDDLFIEEAKGTYYVKDIIFAGNSKTNSICPAGWRPPTKTEMSSLITSYGATASHLLSPPLNFTLSGFVEAGNIRLLEYGEKGHYFSSTDSESCCDTGYELYITNLEVKMRIYSSRRDERIMGLKLRCITKQPGEEYAGEDRLQHFGKPCYGCSK